jgi:acyl CoA:acetate/3-ketoacid CoA transferase alpha subunit
MSLRVFSCPDYMFHAKLNTLVNLKLELNMEVLESGIGELFCPVDPAGQRKYFREHKSMALKSKVMTEHDAVSKFVKPGDYIGFELYGSVRCSMSIAREIARQKIGNLRMVGQGINEIDTLIAADLVDTLDQTYIGYEVHGISRVLRRAVESGRIRVTEWSNAALVWRMRAAAMGQPFIAVSSMLGTDTLKYSAAKVVKDPFTGKKVCLLPASVLDTGIIHVHRCDEFGNCQIDGIRGFAPEMARASKKLIISTEEIISTDEIRKNPDRTVIPYFLTDAVVLAPFGSHPGEMNYVYSRDQSGLNEWLDATATAESTQKYMDRFVFGVKSNEEYLDLIGRDKLQQMKNDCIGR